MGTVTYPDNRVTEYIMENMIPVQLPFEARPESEEHKVSWTPTVIVLDWYGNEHHRSVGFQKPEDFVPFLILGIGKVAFDYDSFDRAIACFNQVLDEYPDSRSAPEAFYLRGVSLFKRTHDSKPLKDAYEELQRRFPQSEWTEKASPYRLL